MDRLETHAHQTMNQGENAITAIQEMLLGLGEDALDGVGVELVVDGELAVELVSKLNAAFFGAPLEGELVLPISLRVKLREDSDEEDSL